MVIIIVGYIKLRYIAVPVKRILLTMQTCYRMKKHDEAELTHVTTVNGAKNGNICNICGVTVHVVISSCVTVLGYWW